MLKLVSLLLVDHFYHELMTRENGRPLPVEPTLNKLLLLLFALRIKILHIVDQRRRDWTVVRFLLSIYKVAGSNPTSFAGSSLSHGGMK